MTINDYFVKFIKRIKPTESEIKKAQKKRNYLEYRLKALDLGIFSVKNSGSFEKKTNIRPLKVIDVVFYIDRDSTNRSSWIVICTRRVCEYDQ